MLPKKGEQKCYKHKYDLGTFCLIRLRTSVATWLACYRMGNGPKPKTAEKWPAKWPAAVFRGRGPKMATRSPGKCPDRQEIPEFELASYLSGHFSAILGHPRKMAAGHFSAIFGSGPVSHSVAGQPSRKTGH